jgi:hypothetical protein
VARFKEGLARLPYLLGLPDTARLKRSKNPWQLLWELLLEKRMAKQVQRLSLG